MSQKQQQLSGGFDVSLVPRGLLALAKDRRYLEECRRLILQLFRRDISNTIDNNNYDSTNTEDDNSWISYEEATLLSSLLYAITVLRRLGRTAGMESVGLSFDTSLPKWMLLSGSMFAAFWVYGVTRLAKQRKLARSLDDGREHLSGDKRRRVFERQRHAMIRRAEIVSNDNSNQISKVADTNKQESPHKTQDWYPLIDSSIESLSDALSSPPAGPNEVVSDNSQVSRPHSLVAWFLRLHLAMYCLNGRYPTLIDRLFYRKSLVSDKMTSVDTSSTATTSQSIAFLIFAQATGIALNFVSRKLIKIWVERRMHALCTTSNQPCITFEGEPPPNIQHKSQQQHQHHQCAICRQSPQYSSCSINCGHVFCWSCLQEWIQTNSPACPLCRKPCAANEVLFLRGY